MKKLLTFVLIVISNIFSQQTGLIPKFPIHKNNIELFRIAQPHQYFDKIGHKSALMGFENGSFEMWIWPWKVLRNFELQFLLGSSTAPIFAKDIVRTISVTPEATTITYTYESFTVKEIIFIPVEEPSAIILLDVYTTEPVTIVPSFFPIMQPQWPAGIGGQYSYWDDNQKSFIISESQQRGLFLCGSPLGKKMSAPPAHMFADNPLQFKIEIKPDDANENYIPILIAGSPVKTKYDSVKTLYSKILNNIQNLYERNYNYYQKLSSSTIQIKTPNEKFNLAYEWGKVALHNLLVDNPTLGKGLVAGYGLSGGGGRPGFAWFFGGDAFINSLAFNSFQDFQTIRDALKFTQKWQRQDNFPIRKKNLNDPPKDVGKMAHELSQSDGLCDWWNDYHFGDNHADTSPWYLVAMGDYYRQSNDLIFIKESWESIKQAFKWCLSKDSNNDGLMDLKGAGLGVLEFGKLVRIHNDLYTQALFIQGLKEIILMAEKVGDSETKKEAENILTKALSQLENLYWIKDLEYYSFGANEEGKQVREKSLYSSTAIMLELLNRENSEKTLKKFNSSEMITDWGARNLSKLSELYEPTNYNYGTVWAFNSIMFTTSLYKYNFLLNAEHLLNATSEHFFNYGLGVVPEVFSGDINIKLGEAYHNQGFSVTGFIVPLIRGMLGLEIDAINKKIFIAPKISANWDFLEVKNIKVGNNIVDIKLNKISGKWKVEFLKSGIDVIDIEFTIVLPLGSKIENVTVNDGEYSISEVITSQAYSRKINLKLKENSVLEVLCKSVPQIFLLPLQTQIGETNKSAKIISQEIKGNKLITTMEIISGMTYEFGIQNYDLIKEVTGAKLENKKLVIQLPRKEKNNFVEHQVIIEMKK